MLSRSVTWLCDKTGYAVPLLDRGTLISARDEIATRDESTVSLFLC
jgi:hypothetical protein